MPTASTTRGSNTQPVAERLRAIAARCTAEAQVRHRMAADPVMGGFACFRDDCLAMARQWEADAATLETLALDTDVRHAAQSLIRDLKACPSDQGSAGGDAGGAGVGP